MRTLKFTDMQRILCLAIACMVMNQLYSQEEARLLRFPAIHGNQVVFTSAGDLYTVAKSGGTARKLTSHEGYEMFARFSPDGNQIAFTGQYDGNTEIFLIPASGGIPKRLTYTATLGRDDISDRMGPNNIVMTWRDNQNIVYRSRKKSFNDFKGQLFAANINGGLSEELPLPVAGFCSFSPDGSRMAYNRVFREFRTWKYYRGGMADDIWIHDFQTKETTNITNNDAQDIIPMWLGNEIYFLSDRDRIMNLFAYDLTNGETRKVTHFNDYDIKFPSAGNQSIIFENGGYIYNFDLSTQRAEKITVFIADDLLPGRDEFKDASKFINTWDVSPDGRRLTLGARGDVWTVPAETGITRNLTQSPGVHDRNVGWSPDGRFISFISDRTGEDEIYIKDQSGSEPAIQITYNSSNYKYNPVWSPDSKKILWSNRNQELLYVNIETKIITIVEHSPDGEIRDYQWSPDSRWITYVLPARDEMNRIWIYSTESNKKEPVTDGWYSSSGPSFSSDGKYLFFSSSRDFNPIYSATEWNHTYRDMSKIYFVTLRRDVENPFRPVNDEVEIKKEEEKKTSPKNDKKDGKTAEADQQERKADIRIDFDGIIGRIISLPVEAGSYNRITAIGNSVYYVMNHSSQKGPKLKMYDLKSQKESEIGDFGNYRITRDQKKMVIRDKGKFVVTELPKSAVKPEKFVDLSNMSVWVDLKAEWKQIFDESWRQMRDYFYDPNMHGVEWKAVHTKYEPLLHHVNNRNDLNYVIGEMIAELNVGHAYVSGGDKPEPERIKTGLLGAELSLDVSGYFRINSILKGQNWDKGTRSPLTEVGVEVDEGDFIIAVNGKPTSEMIDIYQSLVGSAGKQVELTVNSTPSEEGAKKILVIPTEGESQLYYYNWVQDNIDKVTEATDGQVGYIHIPDMGVKGLNEFVKYYYPQLRKRGLIIDDRGNGGGNVSPMIIERLRRELVMMRISRNGTPYTSPGGMHWGPKVMLIDNYSASDGDLFPYQFKTLEMGKLIGVRTWGGVVGIRGSLPFIDGGQLQKPEFATYDREGREFVIEGVGVTPDIIIDNDPAKEYAGVDEQLNKAIEVVLEELNNWPEGLPEVPDYPDKSE
jgi:tricorn protease